MREKKQAHIWNSQSFLICKENNFYSKFSHFIIIQTKPKGWLRTFAKNLWNCQELVISSLKYRIPLWLKVVHWFVFIFFNFLKEIKKIQFIRASFTSATLATNLSIRFIRCVLWWQRQIKRLKIILQLGSQIKLFKPNQSETEIPKVIKTQKHYKYAHFFI